MQFGTSALLKTALLAVAAFSPSLNALPQSLQQAAAAATGHRILTHPSLPAHSLRVVEVPSEVCDTTKGVRSWSGYLDVNVDQLRKQHADARAYDVTDTGITEHFYFWLFESRSNPATDPYVLWLNGGPGCSSFTGLMMELGPCNIAHGGDDTELNPWSWNNNASMIFFDQPTGTGFSYASWSNASRTDKPPTRIYSAVAAARDASAFLQLLGMHSKTIATGASGAETQKKAGSGMTSFHIAGESYAGRWIPTIAAQLVRDNAQAIKHPEWGIDPLPLESVMIGNGITSPQHQFPAKVSYACDPKANTEHKGPILNATVCADMAAAEPKCAKLLTKCRESEQQPIGRGAYSSVACTEALQFCDAKLGDPWGWTGRSYFDWNHQGDYEEEPWFERWLNTAPVRKALGIDAKGAADDASGKYNSCSDEITDEFASTGDGARESTWAVKELLEAGVRVLTYNGRRDFICNYIGNDDWTRALEWSGKKKFNKARLEPWYEDVFAEDDIVEAEPSPSSSSAFAYLETSTAHLSSVLPAPLNMPFRLLSSTLSRFDLGVSGEETKGGAKVPTGKKGRRAGTFRNYGNFTFAIVDSAGHFVPKDQPRAALTLVNRWLHSGNRIQP
ncbi:unnamed protein product [Tilletia laevis]|uniref:Carboxypeptidase n=2 Tax=Tilletia TaxID=13289 RepID=A0A177U124_9BASI|nr:hypothetical protein CF336_g7567 [Tilletia laevis]KAE8247180.1 hypothetical protein A4X03_0g7120 [Tilletia caries]CAD6928278.1 unnamed protein product [Tilletia controversa]KAE8188117.1 hypothetical protein CF335_g6978 [Tilletia laevis]CAD6884379.1 unnamed protein product [Tilletia caries]